MLVPMAEKVCSQVSKPRLRRSGATPDPLGMVGGDSRDVSADIGPGSWSMISTISSLRQRVRRGVRPMETLKKGFGAPVR